MPSLNSSKILSGVSVTSNGASRKPYIIGIVGGTNSGKTTVCKKIIREVRFQELNIINKNVFSWKQWMMDARFLLLQFLKTVFIEISTQNRWSWQKSRNITSITQTLLMMMRFSGILISYWGFDSTMHSQIVSFSPGQIEIKWKGFWLIWPMEKVEKSLNTISRWIFIIFQTDLNNLI